MNFNKKGFEIAMNTVIMLIIGLILFGLGMGLFAKISSSGQNQIDDMRASIVDSLAGLECDSQEWVCVPSITLNEGDTTSGYVYVTNLDDDVGYFKISFEGILTPYNGGPSRELPKTGCGRVIITPYLDEIPISRGEVAKIPFFIDTTQVDKTCSFTTAVKIEHVSSGTSVPGGNDKKSAIIIRVN